MKKATGETINLYQILHENQRHFNNLQSDYRKMASGWLLAVFGGVSFLFTDMELSLEERSLLAGLLFLGGALGVFLLWLLDVRVYHRLLIANTELGQEMEETYENLPRIHQKMIDTKEGPVRNKILLFYFFPMLVLLILSGIGMGYYLYLKGLGIVSLPLCIFLYVLLAWSAYRYMAPPKHSASPKRTILLPEKADYNAPDGSEIRMLSQIAGGGICHCTLPPGEVTQAVRHKTVEELWYVLKGQGELWSQSANDSSDSIQNLHEGVSLNIPLYTAFQFRNTGEVPLQILIATLPPWPGAQEAIQVEGKWK